VRNADYLIKRTLFAIVTVFVALTINFLLFRALPGSAVSGMRCQHCTKEFRESIVKQYGLDKPEWQQYVIYLKNLAHGDLGTSVQDNRPVWQDIKQPLLNTLPMLVVGTLISVILGIISGVIAAWRRSTWLDAGNTWTALSFYAMPTQWIGLLVIFYIAIPLGLPVAGIQSNDLGVLGPVSFGTEVWNRTQHLALPAIVLGLGLYGEYALVVRSSMLETLGEDYVLTARAKGLKNRVIVWHHAFRNAMLPLVTLIALSLGYVVAGQIVVEDVFSYPGIGLATVDAINAHDYPVLQGIFLIFTIIVIAANFIADILYFSLDPRVKA
jgi:ABC-type dipeptide/oligopeptide/nickel transport system permease component